MTVPVWAWAAFVAFVAAMLALDMFVLHRRAHEVSLREAGAWSAVWITIGLGFGVLVWAWGDGGTAQDYLAGYLIEKSLSVDNIFLFAAIFSAFAIPARYQHRVLMYGIIGALLMRAAFIAAGITLLEVIHPVIYVFGAVLLVAAVNMLRGGAHPAPEDRRVLRLLQRLLPATDRLHGQRFVVRDAGRLLATPLLLALVVVETTDVIFAVDSIPAVLAVTTDPFVVYTSNVFALLGMRALYFLLAGATARLRYLQPGLAVILAGVAVKLLLADVWEFPAWSAPTFIIAVLAVVAAASLRDRRHPRTSDPQVADVDAPRDQPGAAAREGSHWAGGPRGAGAATPRAARRWAAPLRSLGARVLQQDGDKARRSPAAARPRPPRADPMAYEARTHARCPVSRNRDRSPGRLPAAVVRLAEHRRRAWVICAGGEPAGEND